ncbi:tail protein X [Roseospira goensis]|uniref:Phage tail protein X n=1 Tax=Roseospira goensis TaxID=391922 RepID=A0A7W6WMJ7_9PROT|nr:tail protein X [Roseospira goensis]MBB4287833.1 phage tail protein X [Roseospira goensis]
MIGAPLQGLVRRGDGSATYTTFDGDMLDHLCWRHYGQEWDMVEAVLDANPGLAALGPVLPAGVTITLPYRPSPASPPTVDVVRLFD